MRASRPISSSFRPRLECLESRDCPSVIVSRSDSELRLVGDNANDLVSIAAQANGGLLVTANGVAQPLQFGVHSIRLYLGGGNDIARMNLAALPQLDLDISASLGLGNDTFNAVLGNRILDDELDIRANLGEGINRFNVSTGAIFGDAELTVCIRGGANGDTGTLVVGNLSGNADVDIDVDLGHGNNTLYTYLASMLDDASLDFEYYGGAGLDYLNFILNGVIAGEAEVDISADLGENNDIINIYGGVIAGDADVEVNFDGGGGFDVLAAAGLLVLGDADLDRDGFEFVVGI